MWSTSNKAYSEFLVLFKWDLSYYYFYLPPAELTVCISLPQKRTLQPNLILLRVHWAQPLPALCWMHWMIATGSTHRGAQRPPDTAAGTTVGPRVLAAGWCPGCSAVSLGPAYTLWPGSSWLCSPERSASGARLESHGTVEEETEKVSKGKIIPDASTQNSLNTISLHLHTFTLTSSWLW